MTRGLACLILATALSGAPARAQEQYDTFGIVDDSATIDPAAPEGSGLPPSLPRPLVGEAPAIVLDPRATDPVAAGLETVPAINPPSDWQSFSFAEITARLPPDFNVMQENDKGAIYFGGDQHQLKGLGFGVILLPSDEVEEMPPDATLLMDKQVSLNGQVMRWREFTMKDGDLELTTIMVSHPRPTESDVTVALAATVYNMPMDQGRADLIRILGTVKIAAAPNPDQIGEGLDGLVSYDVPKDWRVDIGPQGRRVGFSPRGYSGYVVFARGLAVTGAGGADEDIPVGLMPTRAEIYGQPADLYTWTTDQAEFYVGASVVPGRISYFRLLACPDAVAVGIVIAGAPEVIDGDDFRAVLDRFALNLPAGLTACPAVRPATSLPDQMPPVADVVGPTPVVPPPGTSVPKSSGKTKIADTSKPPAGGADPSPTVNGTAVDVQGVSFILPQGWSAQYDRPDNKIFISPDGRWTLLSFWWFPDEPLLGSDDLTAVENVIVDHEPVTRLHFAMGDMLSIQNVTERARSDEDRFIFTLEGRGVSEADLRALHGQLLVNLHLQGGFDPSKRVDPMVGASAPTPGDDPDPRSTGAGPAGTRVDFANGVQGWTGDYADLSAKSSGGPDGSGVLEVFTPGEGRDGYLIAPGDLLGDWTGNEGLRVTIKTQNGRYFDAFEEGAYGDIYIANGTMTAAIAFPNRVGTEWSTKAVSFNSPDWVLGGGARSVAEVLANVTDFRVRGEFLLGDATAWLSSFEIVSGRAVTAASSPTTMTPAVFGGWTSYVNGRFGTRIDYPSEQFHALPPPENGDGLTFQSKDGSAQFLVFGQFNIEGLDARAMMARDRDWGAYDSVTYQTSGDGWYVMSGYTGSNIFYRKVVIDAENDVVHVFELTYPQSERDRFDPIVTRMAKSFGRQ